MLNYDLDLYNMQEDKKTWQAHIEQAKKNMTSGLVVLLIGIILIAVGIVWIGGAACLLGGLTALGNWTGMNEAEANIASLDEKITRRWNEIKTGK